MKKAILVIVIFLCSVSLYSEEPVVKFYLQDGSSKQYNLGEIESMKFSSAPDILQLHIFKNNGKSLYYPAQLIDSIKFAVDSTYEDRLHLWHDGFIWDIAIHEIDSILLYYTTYTAVTIGEQHWMYRNLNVDRYRNGDSIPEVTDPMGWKTLKTGAWSYYNNDTVLGKIYGKLYNWYVINDIRGISPDGWHMPSQSEWLELENNLGGYQFAGGKLKMTNTPHWYSPNKGATNESGLSALPGGICGARNNPFLMIGTDCFFWFAPKNEGPFSFFSVGLNYDSELMFFSLWNENAGCSIRCIKD